MTRKQWSGTWPTKCDLCKKDLKQEDKFFDARTWFGPWALMCVVCFASEGVGLGLGKGQMYDSKTLEKIGG